MVMSGWNTNGCSGQPAILLRRSVLPSVHSKSQANFFLLSQLRNAQLQMQEAPPNTSPWELTPQEGSVWLAVGDYMFIGFRVMGSCVCVFNLNGGFLHQAVKWWLLWSLLDVPRLLGIAQRNPTGKYLKLPSGQDLQYPSDWWEWGCFPEQSRLLF